MMSFTDIHPLTWLPPRLQPYALLMRLDRPAGTWLLLLPCWWALALSQAPWWMYLDFALGAVVMRGAGCVVNDLWDRDIDRKVERTKDRPLASGAIKPRQALIFLAGLLLIGLALLLPLGWLAIQLGVLSLLLVGTYPLMKRITWWPQAFLGFTFNWGVLLGAAAATGTLPMWVCPLYAGGVLWTLAYDTLYAHADIADDTLIGVKSSARRLGDMSRLWITYFYVGAGLLALLTGAMVKLGLGFYLGLAVAVLQVVWLMHRWRPENPARCIAAFKANRITGMLLLLAIVAGQLTR